MNENEFKKLASNSRDWLIFQLIDQLLSERSKEVFEEEDSPERIALIKGTDHAIALDLGLEGSKELIPVEYGNKTFSRTPLKDKIDAYDKELGGDKVEEVRRSHPLDEPSPNSDISLRSKLPEPKGETTVQEEVTGKVVLVTDKAVLIGNADRVAWFPKSVILNLDKIALKQGERVELKIVDWFKYKIEWKVPE